ncbi:hypothetical protein CDAR_399681 [Caerostris darwini]|uniref:Uncharacterized protein n=1 Tax=Caerostris darwini TaxID=1538125 RepID=A0AAV4P3X7_9ARAC|nr:hypothetical protein CDAR_399681 [Caerostris darwini]
MSDSNFLPNEELTSIATKIAEKWKSLTFPVALGCEIPVGVISEKADRCFLPKGERRKKQNQNGNSEYPIRRFGEEIERNGTLYANKNALGVLESIVGGGYMPRSISVLFFQRFYFIQGDGLFGRVGDGK